MATPATTSLQGYSISFLRQPLSFSASLVCVWLLLCSANEFGRATAHESHHLLQLSSLLPAFVCNHHPTQAFASDVKSGSSLKVVHKHGPCSHQTHDRANAPTLAHILAQDQSRVDSIHSRLSKTLDASKLRSSSASLPAKSGHIIGSGNYIVTVGLGTPKRDLSLVFDTGSDLTWTQCEPCAKSCYSQKDPKFDPSKSSSYSNITCTSALCTQVASNTGITPACSSSTCIYGIQYADQSSSVGFFGKEKLTLTSSDVVYDFLFGCGQNNQGLFSGSAGLLGLGQDPISVVSQTAQKYGKFFSYCLPSTTSSNGYLKFGNNGISGNAKFTPFVKDSRGSSFYFLDLQAISVGGVKLRIPVSVFSTAGTLIDSGTVISRLPPAAYAALRTAFRKGMSSYPITRGVSILDTCYDLTKYSSVSIPKVSLFFRGGVEAAVDASGILYVASSDLSQVCLAFAANSNAGDAAIFGNVQQQTLDVIYDVAGGRLGIASGGCS